MNECLYFSKLVEVLIIVLFHQRWDVYFHPISANRGMNDFYSISKIRHIDVYIFLYGRLLCTLVAKYKIYGPFLAQIPF
jgi:hypothetical protein